MELLNERTLDNMTPKEIVESLDKYVNGQNDAKRTIAVALRNRVRRKRLPKEIRDEVSPKNILMIGSTGVGFIGIFLSLESYRLERLAIWRNP